MSEATVPPAEEAANSERNPWLWIPSLYFAEGIPNIVVVAVAIIMFENLGISNTDAALYTGSLYLPWVIKPFWSPLVDLIRTKRWWVIITQLVLGVGFAGVGLSVTGSYFLGFSLFFLWVLAFTSATHDIAADGFYMLGLTSHDQAWFVGVRSTFYRVAVIVGKGLLVVLAGRLGKEIGVAQGWAAVFYMMGAIYVVLAGYHALFLPRPVADTPSAKATPSLVLSESLETFLSFFRKPNILSILAFLLLYRFAEAQLGTVSQLFMLGEREKGGLQLDTEAVGWINGTVGIIMLTLGGIIGGMVAAKHGLRFWLWGMVLAMNVPNLTYVFLAYTQPEQLWPVGCAVAIEQFGYGFGFTAYMLFTLYIAKGEHETAHYAIGTGFMALGMMLPGMASGWLQTRLGYQHFFLWVMLCTIPSFAVCKLVKIDPHFGRRVGRRSDEQE